MKEGILAKYQACLPQLVQLRDRLEGELRGHLQGLKVSSVVGRVKSLESLREKLLRPDRTYGGVEDIHDLVALRVVTYFDDGVEQVANLVERQYRVDFQHSIDKGRQLDPTQFGYRSLHYVCELPHGSSELPLKFEIQIRSILQHAWAQIEHDLGYKSSDSIPLEFRRRFSRLAGLLELADEQFVALRNDMEQYSRSLRQDVIGVPIDSLSLGSFVTSESVAALDQHIARWLGAELTENPFYPQYLARMMEFLGLKELDELALKLDENETRIRDCLAPYFQFSESVWGLKREDVKSVERGYCLLFFAHVCLMTDGNLEIERLERLRQFYQYLDYPDQPEHARQVALAFLEAWPS